MLSYIVRGRSREIGIRTALGAQRADVLRLLIVEGMPPALVGIAAGHDSGGRVGEGHETFVFGVSASDPLTLAAVEATLALVVSIGQPGAAPRIGSDPKERQRR